MNPIEEVIIGGHYRHYKRGHLYEVVGFALHSETYEEMVIYKALYECEEFGPDRVWVRPKAIFLEKVWHEGRVTFRFIKEDSLK